MRTLQALSGRPPRKDFSDFVQALPAPSRLLGLTHVTTGYILREFIDQGSIAPVTLCPVIKEPLTYAFYGRSAFRRKDDDKAGDLSFLFPVVLILDPARTPPAKYAFAFDSGAFMKGAMDQYLDPYMPLFDFHIAPDPVEAARLVNAVFGDSNSFLQNKPRNDFDVPEGNFEAVSYHKLVYGGGRGAERLDDRASTPELLFDTPLDLATCVKAAIMPDVLASEAPIGKKLQAMGIQVLDYEWTGGSRPSEYHMAIRSLVKSTYENFSWL